MPVSHDPRSHGAPDAESVWCNGSASCSPESSSPSSSPRSRCAMFNLAPAEFYTYDRHAGWKIKPGAYGWQTHEGRALIEANSDGFRGPEYAVEKPPGTLRVAVLGDSFTEAQHVAFEDTFCAVAQRDLQAQCPFAVGGEGTPAAPLHQRRGDELRLRRLRHRAGAGNPAPLGLALFPRCRRARLLQRQRRPQQFGRPRGRQVPSLLRPSQRPAGARRSVRGLVVVPHELHDALRVAPLAGAQSPRQRPQPIEPPDSRRPYGRHQTPRRRQSRFRTASSSA